MNQRQIRRIANERAALMIDSSLNYGWEPDDLIAEIGQENVDRVAEEIGDIAKELFRRVGKRSWCEQAGAEARGEVPGRTDPGVRDPRGLGGERGRAVRRGNGGRDRNGDPAPRRTADRSFRQGDIEGKKYAVCPGFVVSANSDGNRHFVSFEALARLYGVKPEECLLIPPTEQGVKLGDQREDLIWLYPQRRGADYDVIRRELARGPDAFKLD